METWIIYFIFSFTTIVSIAALTLYFRHLRRNSGMSWFGKINAVYMMYYFVTQIIFVTLDDGTDIMKNFKIFHILELVLFIIMFIILERIYYRKGS